MKRKKLVLETVFLVLLILSAIFLQKLYAQTNICELGYCFDYDKAFSSCDSFCLSNRGIGCEDVWFWEAYCNPYNKCDTLFWMICQDGYHVRRYQYDNCPAC